MGIEEKIKRIRSYKNMTQEEIAEKLNISPQAYSKLERGETKLDIHRLEQLAQVFEMNLEDIYNLDNNGQFVKFNDFFTAQRDTVQLQHNNYLQNEKLVELLEKTIEKQDREIIFLREQVQLLNKLLSDSRK